MPDKIHDLIGVGFGPSNLALAIALHESASPVQARFLEARPAFAWHPDMMIDGADMQVSFLKDLVSLRDPTSGFSFLNYLHHKGRLERFINRKTFFPSRHEYNDYLGWAAARLGPVCVYDQRVTAVEAVEKNGAVDLLAVTAQDAQGNETQRFARNLVLAPGGQPFWPDCFADQRGGPAVIHACDYISARQARLKPGLRIAVLGGGQSAAEIFADLAAHPAAPQLDLILRGHAIRPADDSAFVNEIFGIGYTDRLFALPPEARSAFLRDFAATNYSVADADLIARLYELLYEQEVQGGTRLRLLRETRVVSARSQSAGVVLEMVGGAGAAPQSEAYDLVILATGYRRALSETVLAGLRPWMTDSQPGRDYRLPMAPRFAPQIFVQGYSEATHGLSDTLLSVLPARAQEIAAALAPPSDAARRPVLAAE